MIPFLPEVLFYDIEKEEQEYEEQPKAIFCLNVIVKAINQQVVHYTNLWYKNLSQITLFDFKDDIEKISNFALFLPKQQAEDETFYIIDDEEDEDEFEELPDGIEKEDKDSFDLLGGWDFFKKIRDFYKKIKRAYKTIKKFAKKARNLFKKIKQTIKKLWRRAKRWVRKKWRQLKSFCKRVYRKHIKPFLRKVKRMFKRFAAKARRYIRKLLPKLKRFINRIWKKFVLRMVKRFIKRGIKKLAKSIVKKAIKMLIKMLIKGLAHLVAGAAGLTGVGVVATVAIEGALIAWDIYDMTHDTDTEPPDDFEKDEEADAEKESLAVDANRDITEARKQKKLEKPPPLPNSFKSYDIKTVEETEIHSYIENLDDTIAKTLYNSKEYPLQILGRFYIFYNTTYSWLEGQDNFISKISPPIVEHLNKIQDNILDLMDKYYDNDWYSTVKKNLPKKDPKKVKPRPKRTSMQDILKEDKYIKEGHSQWFHYSHGVDVNKIEKNKIKQKNFFNSSFYDESSKGKHDILNRSERYTKYVFNQELNISGRAGKPVDMRIVMAPYDKKKQQKRNALAKKNFLLYQLFCCIAWIKTCCDEKMNPSSTLEKIVNKIF